MLFSIVTTIFLIINHLRSTFASPTTFKNIFPATQSRDNLTQLLAKRYLPSDSRCGSSTWISRRCLSLLGDRAWQDECLVTVGDHQITSLVVSLCPVNKICMNDQIEGKLTSLCIARPAANTDPNTPEQQQTGYYPVEGTIAPVQNPGVSVTLAKSIPLACVSAMIEGDDGDYIIAPESPLVGTVRGGSKICDYNVTNRDCVPTGPISLNTGAIIDFSFGLSIQQVGRFYYAISGHGF